MKDPKTPDAAVLLEIYRKAHLIKTADDRFIGSPPLAFKIGASVALLFSVFLLARSYFLTEERFRRSEAWRSLRPDERPAGDRGPLLARDQFHLLLLRFARGGAAIAVFLYGSALVLSAAMDPSGSDTIVTARLADPG